MPTALLAVSAKAIRFAQHVMDAQTLAVHARVEIVGVLLDWRSHCAGEAPTGVRQRLQAMLAGDGVRADSAWLPSRVRTRLA